MKTQNYIYNQSRYDSPESAFKKIKSEIHTILEAAKQLNIDKDWQHFAQILEGKFDIQRHVRSKILSIYYPDQFLQMHSKEDAKKMLESLFAITKDEINKGLFLKQRKLLEIKNSHPIMKKWNNGYFSTFIWRALKYFSSLGDVELQELLEKNVSKSHINILKKFYERRGKYLRADEIYRQKKMNKIVVKLRFLTILTILTILYIPLCVSLNL